MRLKWHRKRNKCGEGEGVSIYYRSWAEPGKSMLPGMDPAGTVSKEAWLLHRGLSLLSASDCLLVDFEGAASVPTSSLPIGFEKRCGVMDSHQLSCP